MRLDSVKLSTVHRKEKAKGEKKVNADTTIHTREEGPTAQLCGDSEVVSKWISGQYSLDRGTEDEMAKFKNLAVKVEKGDCQPHFEGW